MSAIFYILFLVFFFFLGSIATDKNVCETEICKKFVDELKSSMNETANPCDDFSSYICGNFGKSHPIPPGQSSSNSFSEISDKITVILKDLLENQPLSESKVPQTKAALFYKSCMNKNKRNEKSKLQILESIKKFKSISFQKDLAKLIKNGITSRIASFESTPDSKNPNFFQLSIGLPSLILSEATLKSQEDPNSQKQIESLKKFMKKILGFLEMWTKEDTAIQDVIDLNIQIAKAFPSIADQNNPDKYYNNITINHLQALCPEIQWSHLINEILKDSGKHFHEKDAILLASVPYFTKMCKVLKTYKSEEKLKKVLYNDLIWAEVSSLLSLGSDDIIEASDELAKDLFGITGKEELWKTCVGLTSSTFVEIVGNMYVKKAFDASKKTDIENMLQNIKKSLQVVIENVNWMDKETKEKALTKLRTIKQKIGYPESILNETKLSLEYFEVDVDENSLIKNYHSFKKVAYKNSLKGIGKRIPDDIWFMGPHQVNAYYNPSSNEIVFPAAILQYPFYDIDLPVTSNYGGIGMVIGHEILHGFDTSGSKFDELGMLRNWWTPETKEKYTEKAKCIENQYGSYSIYNEKLPSQQTIGEDIADNAGIRMSYFASQASTKEKLTLPGMKFTPEQLFFVHEARSWCSHSTKEALLEIMKADVHTVWTYRINGPLSNMPEFSKAFNCGHDNKMNRHKKCLVW